MVIHLYALQYPKLSDIIVYKIYEKCKFHDAEWIVNIMEGKKNVI